MLERRNSTSRPPCERVLMRPSCGRRFSATSMRPRILMRDVTAVITGVGNSNTLCMTPSMRKRMWLVSRRGSRWMSDARCSNAYCSSQSTMCTTWRSSAPSSPVLPSSTSCSKLRIARPSLTIALGILGALDRALHAPPLGEIAADVERIGDDALDVRRRMWPRSAIQRVSNGSLVANTTCIGADRDRQDAIARSRSRG